MKKTDEQLANELDMFLTARLHGQPLPDVSEELLTDIAFVDSLLETAAQAEPKAMLLSDVKAKLALEANKEQQSATHKMTRPASARPSLDDRPFWEELIQNLKDMFTMKRTVFAFGAVIALFVFAFMAWSAFQTNRPGEPGIIVESTVEPTPGETADPVEVAELPQLPNLSSANGLGGGFGGGGGGDGEVGVAEAGIDMRVFNPLSGTQFILNTTLPIEPTSAVVYQQPPTRIYDLEDVPGLAAIFGINGPIYTEKYFIEEGSEWTPSPVYQIFDGTRSLSVGENYFYFYDEAGTVYTGSVNTPMAFEQAKPIAEAFLQQSGLVDFEYVLRSQNGSDIEVRRVVNGREVHYSEFFLAINNQGQIWSFSGNPLKMLNTIGEYPLRSAEDAWQYMLENGVDFQTVFFQSYPSDPTVFNPEPVDQGDFRYWQRTFEPGQEVTIYPYPGAMTAVNGDAPPRIMLDMFILNGPADQLEAISENVGKQIRVVGIVGESVGLRQTLELVSWEPFEKEYTFREGTIQITDGQGILQTLEGESIIIPDLPSDLNDGERVYVSGWIDEGARGEEDSFNWQSMGIIVDQPEFIEGEPEPLPVDGPIVGNPFGISEVTIDQATIEYAVLTIWDEETQSPSFYLQPVWQFKGLTDSGDIIEIYVQAIQSDYITTPAQ